MMVLGGPYFSDLRQFYDILQFRKGKKRHNPLKEKYKSNFIRSTLFYISGYISKYLSV